MDFLNSTHKFKVLSFINEEMNKIEKQDTGKKNPTIVNNQEKKDKKRKFDILQYNYEIEEEFAHDFGANIPSIKGRLNVILANYRSGNILFYSNRLQVE